MYFIDNVKYKRETFLFGDRKYFDEYDNNNYMQK